MWWLAADNGSRFILLQNWQWSFAVLGIEVQLRGKHGNSNGWRPTGTNTQYFCIACSWAAFPPSWSTIRQCLCRLLDRKRRKRRAKSTKRQQHKNWVRVSWMDISRWTKQSSLSTATMEQQTNNILFIQHYAKIMAITNKLNNIITSLDMKAPCGVWALLLEPVGIF